MNDRVLVPMCLLAGVLVINGTRGVGWIAHYVMPGLALGVVFYVLVKVLMAVKR
ncbi:hypothetical protein HOU00_gp324 [Caulobacter phage CcrPW]|uniref:Uncharacterized protein n=1 Tax=Caulobacter phage CcrPW TaxID=2283271 RepID=A0A385EA93_9CAUD|nr:hypothetical protein HOU00_gp324 [Caulobacter phage CcrPW]AXQ68801.1 hypothetical protein CcrPW_gp262 [Caulobacter phage CcrPW]